MKRKVVHFEIGCDDIDKTSIFYEAVFNWNLTRQGNFTTIDTGKGDTLNGHINQLGPEDPQNYVTICIETDSLTSDLKAIESNGGEIFVNPIKLADGREFAWFKDVSGNLIGLITPKIK